MITTCVEKCPLPCCRHNSTRVNTFVETLRSFAKMINKSKNSCRIQYGSIKKYTWFACLTALYDSVRKMFKSKHTFHGWKWHNASHAAGWRATNVKQLRQTFDLMEWQPSSVATGHSKLKLPYHTDKIFNSELRVYVSFSTCCTPTACASC